MRMAPVPTRQAGTCPGKGRVATDCHVQGRSEVMRGLLGAYGGNAAQALAPKTGWPAAASAARRPAEPPQAAY